MMIVALCAGFASCSNDDDEKNEGAYIETADLIGTWNAIWVVGNYTNDNDPTKNKEWNCNWENAKKLELDWFFFTTMKFDTVNKGEATDGDDKYAFAWTLKNSILSVDFSEGQIMDVKIVDHTGNTIVVETSSKEGSVNRYEKVTYQKVK